MSLGRTTTVREHANSIVRRISLSLLVSTGILVELVAFSNLPDTARC